MIERKEGGREGGGENEFVDMLVTQLTIDSCALSIVVLLCSSIVSPSTYFFSFHSLFSFLLFLFFLLFLVVTFAVPLDNRRAQAFEPATVRGV